MSRYFDPLTRELLDCPSTPRAEIAKAAGDLETLNRRFGGHRLVRRFLERWFNPGRCYRVLDLCTGGGDVPRAMVEWARAREITLRVDAVDANPSTIEYARERSAEFPEIHYASMDVLRDAPGDDYDLVHCSLALHHFSDADAARLLARAEDLATRWVLVSDLDRNPISRFIISFLVRLVCKNEITRHDGRVSIRHAFSYGELRDLAETAGWERFSHARSFPCRQALWIEKRELGDIPLVDAEIAGLA